MAKPTVYLKSAMAGLVAALLVVAVPILFHWWRVTQRLHAFDSSAPDPYFHDTYFVVIRPRAPLFAWLLAAVVFAVVFYWGFRRERSKG